MHGAGLSAEAVGGSVKAQARPGEEEAGVVLFRDIVAQQPWFPFVPPEYRTTKEQFESQCGKLRDAIRQAVPFQITNVAEYFYLGTPQEVWSIYHDFPRPVPPFQNTWMEWTLPKTTFSLGEHKELDLGQDFSRVGCLMGSRPLDEDILKKAFPDVPYILSLVVFAERRIKNSPPLMFPQVSFGLTKDWNPVSFCKEKPGNVSYVFHGANPGPGSDEALGDIGKTSCSMLYPALLAISLLNCKNVSTSDVKVDAALVRSHKRKGRDITPGYKVIEIQPLTKHIKNVSGETGYSSKVASIIRGHFKDYSQGKGLFGKYKGMFWWDQRLSSPDVEYRLKDAGAALDKNWIAKPTES